MGVVLIGLGLGFGFRQSVGSFILRRVLRSLGSALNAEITYQGLGGDVFVSPHLSGVEVIFKGDSADSAVASVLIRDLSVRYDLLALLRKKIVFSEVQVQGLQVFINGKSQPRQGEGEFKPSFPNMVVRRLKLTDGQLVLQGTPRIDSAQVVLALVATPANLMVTVDSFRCVLPQESIRVNSFSAGVRLSQDSLQVTGLKLRTPGSGLNGELTVDLRTGGVIFQVAELNLNMREVVHVPGRLQLTGQVEREEEKLKVQSQWVVDGLLWRSIPLPRLTGAVSLSDSIVKIALAGGDTALGSFHLAGNFNINDYRFTASLVVESLGVSRLDERLPEFRMSAEIQCGGVVGSLAQLFRQDTIPRIRDSVYLEIVRGSVQELGVDTITALMGYQDGRIQLRGLSLKGPAGDFNFIGLAREGLLRARCEMRDFDLRVLDRFLSLGISGRARGDFSLLWDRDDWEFSGTVFFNGFSAGDKVEVTEGILSAELSGEGYFAAGQAVSIPVLLSARDLNGRLAVGGEGVKFAGQEWNGAQFVWTGPEFDLRLERGDERLSVMGDISGTTRGIDGLIRSLELSTPEETVALLNPAEVLWQGDSLVVRNVKFGLAGGEAGLEMVVVGSRAPEVQAYGRALNLRKVQRLFRVETELWGVLDFDVTGGDTLTLTFAGTDFGIPAWDLDFKAISGSVKVGRSRARIERVAFVHHFDTSSVSGEVGYEMAGGFHIRDVAFDIRLADPGNWLFKVAQPYVEIKDGLVYGAVMVRWQEDMLRLNGRARVSQGVMVVPSVAATVERVEADLTLREDKIFLEKLSGRSQWGTVTAEGIIDLNERFVLDSILFKTHFNGVSAVPLAGVYAIGGGDITISWHDGEERAFIAGQTEIEEALIVMGFEQSGPGNGNGSAGVDLDIKVLGQRGVWLRNRDMDIELAVDLTIRQVGTEAVYTGELTCRQGSVYYLDHILRVKEGTLVFANISSFNPQMDITAELPIARGTGRNNTPERVILKLTGTFQEPAFTFYSEPPVWDESQIISYLGLNVTMDELSAMEQKELLNRLLTERVLGYFQTQIARRVREFVSLDYLELETGILSGTGAKVTVGKYVGRNLYVSYTQSFAGQLEPSFRVEYYLNRRNELLAERSADGRYSFRYLFKIRY